MANWFECKIRYSKTAENGIAKNVTEPYLVDALSFTEAEKRITEEMKAYISGEYEVTDIKRARYNETFDNGESAYWYKCKVLFITVDEKTGAEKKIAAQMLVRAGDIHEALKLLDEGMKGTLADYVIVTIQETAIMDVFYYAPPATGEKEEQ